MKIELHLLQNFPPHNLNRDDTGAPKDTEFGGWRRSRISSQALKRSIRMSDAFARELSGRIGIRTKRSVDQIADRLMNQYGKEAGPSGIVAQAVISRLIARTDSDGKTNVLFYVGNDELDDIAGRISSKWDQILPAIELLQETEKDESKGAEKKKAEAEKNLDNAISPLVKEFVEAHRDRVGSVDIALFGRMLAEKPELKINAACQVAHAISTNRVSMEFDYYTAVDDLNPKEQTGAGMIGTVGYNSSCFYRYALIDADQLAANLGGADEGARALSLEGIRAFIRGSVVAIPNGKQNSFAALTPPQLVMVVVRPKGAMPMSLANAFEKPVRPSDTRSLVEQSIAALDAHWNALSNAYGQDGAQVFVLTVTSDMSVLEALSDYRCATLDDVIEKTIAAVKAGWEAETTDPLN